MEFPHELSYSEVTDLLQDIKNAQKEINIKKEINIQEKILKHK